MKITSIIVIVVLVIGQLMAGCGREVNLEHESSPEQIAAFNDAVAHESTGNPLRDPQSMHLAQVAYMKVVAIDPSTSYGRAAAERVEQLSRQLEARLSPR